MKKFISLFIALVMLAAEAVPVFAASDYSDVPRTHWAYDYIARSTDKKWFGGYPDGTFHPNDSITRAEALTVYVTFLGLELPDVTMNPYYDVDANAWYASYVEAGKELLPERMSIQGKIPFQPDMPITREDAMYALVKALGYDSMTEHADQSVLNMFSDKNSISSNVKSYVAVAVSQKLVSGRDDGTIGAQDPLTRAEFATLLYQASFSGFNVSSDAKLHSVSIEPSVKKELNVGESFTIRATALYSDNSTKEYTNINPYNADDNGVVSINQNTITAVKSGTCEIKFNDSYLKDKAITVIVNKNDAAPSIVIDGYQNTTEDSEITITGKVTDDASDEITLKCNGNEVYLKTNGTFSADLSLKTGINEFEFIAENEFGNKTTKTVTIERTAKKSDSSDDDKTSGDDSDTKNDDSSKDSDTKDNDTKDDDTNNNTDNDKKPSTPKSDNDGYTYLTAIDLGINDTATGNLGSTLSDGKTDKVRYYKVVMPKDGVLSISYTADAELYTYLRLYAKDGSSTINNDSGQNKMLKFSSAVMAGTYYIRIEKGNGSGNYTITTSAELQDAENDDEKKGDYISANEMKIGDTKIGHIGYISDSNERDKKDWYTFEVSENAKVTVSLLGDADLYTYLYLYAEDGSSRLASASGSNKTLSLSKDLTPGKYYILIERSNGYGAYRLTVK